MTSSRKRLIQAQGYHREEEVAGVTVLEWFTAMIEGTEEWVDLVDESLK